MIVKPHNGARSLPDRGKRVPRQVRLGLLYGVVYGTPPEGTAGQTSPEQTSANMPPIIAVSIVARSAERGVPTTQPAPSIVRLTARKTAADASSTFRARRQARAEEEN
jgi:hypothetical protein